MKNSYEILYVSLLIFNWLSNWTSLLSHSNWALVCGVRLNLINHLIGFIPCQFACNLALSNPVFRWETCKGSEWESVKKCLRLCKEIETRDWISRVTRGLQVARSCTRAEHVKSWRVAPTVALQDKSPRLARPLAHGLNSRLNPVARLSQQNALFGKK